MRPHPLTQDTLRYYQDLRETDRELNSAALVPRLSEREIRAGAKDLGLLKGNTLLFEDGGEINTLMDYCLLFPSEKKSALQREIEQGGHDMDSVEMRILQALRQAYYSVFKLKYNDGEGFCLVKDIFTGETLGLIDMALSQSPYKAGIAGNLIPILGTKYWMTSGVVLPVLTKSMAEGLLPIIGKFWPYTQDGTTRLNRNRQKLLAKQVIRFLLRNNVFGVDE